MMRSLSSGVTGLRAHQTRMDVIGNNIANVNTYGFKSSRVTFTDVYYQNINGASAGISRTQGGTNPTQIGYGSQVATIDTMVNVSGASSTDRALDIYISGDGFLICDDGQGNIGYTRLGNLGFDSAGNLVDGNGRLIQGAQLDANRNPIINADGSITQLETISCDPAILDRLTGISISNSGAIIGVLSGDKIVQVASKGPDFINMETISVPASSNYAGNLTLKVGAIPSTGIATGTYFDTYKTMVLSGGQYTNTADGTTINISNVQRGDDKFNIDPNALSYELSFDVGTGVFTLTSTDASSVKTSYTGTVSGNEVTFIDGSNKVMSMTVSLPLPTANWSCDVSKAMIPQTYNSPTIPANINLTSVEYGNVGLPADATYELTYDGTKTFTLAVKGSLTDPKGNVIYTGTIAEDGTVVLKNSGTGNTALTIMVDKDNLPTGQSSFVLSGMNQLKYQVQTSDDGGNTHKMPETPQAVPTSGTGQLEGLDGIYIELNGNNVTTFVGNIGVVKNGEETQYTIGNIALAKFANPGGMKEIGSGYYGASPNSGGSIVVRPGIEGTGETSAGYLEMSNVDVSKEFTDMITTQRGFQANSRIITVSDTMLEELVNLKR